MELKILDVGGCKVKSERIKSSRRRPSRQRDAIVKSAQAEIYLQIGPRDRGLSVRNEDEEEQLTGRSSGEDHRVRDGCHGSVDDVGGRIEGRQENGRWCHNIPRVSASKEAKLIVEVNK
jgi:hypothetical protein